MLKDKSNKEIEDTLFKNLQVKLSKNFWICSKSSEAHSGRNLRRKSQLQKFRYKLDSYSLLTFLRTIVKM